MLRTDGMVEVAMTRDRILGSNGFGISNFEHVISISTLEHPAAGLVYTQIAAAWQTLALRVDDGRARAITFGHDDGPVDIESGCVQVVTSRGHAAFLKHNGSCVARGDNHYGQCNFPALPGELTYTHVAVGDSHTVLLRCDGTAVAYGDNYFHQCDIPPLVADVTYVRVTAGYKSTVLIRSDGAATACGFGRAGIILNPPSSIYTFVPHALPMLMLQATLVGRRVKFLSFSGAERCRTDASPGMRLSELYRRLRCEWRYGRLGRGMQGVDAVLPNGRLLSGASPDETVASAWGLRPRRVCGKRKRAAYWGVH